MTRSELVTILADLLSRNVITAEAMAVVLQQYDAGALTDLPLSATRQDDDNSWLLALSLLLTLTGGAVDRANVQRTLRSQFEGRVSILAADVVTTSTIATWQAGMVEAIELYARQMAIAGAGTMPSDSTRRQVDDRLSGQWGYLAGFAVTLLAGKLIDRMISEAAIRARSALYGGTGWGAYYLGQGDNADRGYVDQWITKDDRRVCPRCSPRHKQYYLPGQGIMPGWDCLGTCRCKRVLVYNPQVYAQLGGR